jgi:hypothetical protein
VDWLARVEIERAEIDLVLEDDPIRLRAEHWMDEREQSAMQLKIHRV